LPGTGNCRAALCKRQQPARARRDNFLSFAIAANKDGTLYKSPANSHFALNLRENALSGVASIGKNSGLPLHLVPLFRENLVLLATIDTPTKLRSQNDLKLI
jgi:hypothetical protein